MNFFDYSCLINKLQIVIDDFGLFFKIQIVIGCFWNLNHLRVEKIFPSVPPGRDLQVETGARAQINS